MKEIIIAGGCFWGVEAYFQRLNGVIKTEVGYTDGVSENPTYKEVCSGTTNHAEACKIIYDENIITLKKILEHFFRIIDPTSVNKQGNDRGVQYRTGVYYHLKKTFEAGRYTRIKRIDFKKAMNKLTSFGLSDLEEYQTRLTPRQKEIAALNDDDIIGLR